MVSAPYWSQGLAALKRRTYSLGFLTRIAAVNANAVRSAHAFFVIIHTVFSIARNGHALIGHFIAHIIGGRIGNRGIRIAAGFITAAGFLTVYFDIRAAAALVFIAGTMNDMAF